jgi:RNA polymerase sigma-B factor
MGMSTFLACTDGAIEGTEDRVCLGEALTELDDDERGLLLMRYVEEMTQREIGAARGVSQMQVSRTLRRITDRLQDQLREETAETDTTESLTSAS